MFGVYAVQVAGTRASIGDVPLNVIEVDKGRAGYRSSRATCTSPFTVHIILGIMRKEKTNPLSETPRGETPWNVTKF